LRNLRAFARIGSKAFSESAFICANLRLKSVCQFVDVVFFAPWWLVFERARRCAVPLQLMLKSRSGLPPRVFLEM
jgi:hypothetical protein